MQEYIQAKRRHAIDFQLRMCEMPFNQYCKTKVRDKGYQALGERDMRLTIQDMKEIFSVKKEDSEPTTADAEDDCESPILKQAYYISKSVPRQSNRCKWRQKSGHAPDMLLPLEQNKGRLYVGDLVFYPSLETRLLHLIVTEELVLSNEDLHLSVKTVDGKNEYCLELNKFLCDQGHIVAIPSSLYAIEDGNIMIQDTVLHQLEYIQTHQPVSRTDKEWEALLEDDSDQVLLQKTTTRKQNMETGKEQIKRKPRKKKNEDACTSKVKQKRKRESDM